MKTIFVIIAILVVIYILQRLALWGINKICMPSKEQIRINALYHSFKENPSNATDEELKDLRTYFSSSVSHVPCHKEGSLLPTYTKTLSGMILDEVIEEIKKREEK